MSNYTQIEPWKITGSQYLLRDRWLTVRVDDCLMANGQPVAPYYVLEESDWVHVVATDEEGRVLLVRQYRHAAQRICLELPGGVIDDGETPEQAAVRELREETGYSCSSIRAVGTAYPNPARQTNRVHTFVASGLSLQHKQQLDQSEEIEALFMTRKELEQAIKTGDFCQSMHIASLMMAWTLP